MIKKIFQEEIMVPILILATLAISFSPFIYEVASVKKIPTNRYPLLESDFAPDMRVYLSRMQEGYEGKWLVSEKYTSESHRPSLLHISYLLMGKTTGIFRIPPTQAFPIWKLICGAFMLVCGYYFILSFLANNKLRIVAFLLFVFSGNLPMLSATGIPLLGKNLSLFLGWYTFYDPVKRTIFLPHYSLSAGFLSLSLVFLWRAVDSARRFNYLLAGIFAFLAGIILPTNFFVICLVALMLVIKKVTVCVTERQILTEINYLVKKSWLFWLLVVLGMILIKESLSYFPWNVQSGADAAKRYIPFEYFNVLMGLGTVGIVGLLGTAYVLIRNKKEAYLSGLWILSVIYLILIFEFSSFSHPSRLLQVEVHLPLVIASVVLLDGLSALFIKKRNLIFGCLVFILFSPSLFVWPISLKAQKIFVDTKIVASFPLIPKQTYVVYPIKSVMEAIFWLRDQTSHDDVVLAAETLGSMIPAYSGNTVYLGHGNQTVYFDDKVLLMKMFYGGGMTDAQQIDFLKKNRIKYVFWGPEEKEISANKLNEAVLVKVYEKSEVAIFKVGY